MSGDAPIRVQPGTTRMMSAQAPPGLAGVLEWRVEDSANVVIVGPSTAGVVEFATTSYRAPITFPLAAADSLVYVVWRNPDTGDEAFDEVYVLAAGVSLSGPTGYPTVAELVAASSGEAREALDALDADQLDALRTGAIVAVEAFCRQSFTSEGSLAAPIERRLDGNGTDRVYLPRRLAVATSVNVDGAELAEGDFDLSEQHEFVRLISPIGGSWLTRVRRRPGDLGPTFGLGRANVVVAGVWGWTADEWEAGELAPVVEAIRFDMEDQALADANRLASTVRSARSLGVENLSQGNLSVALSPGESALSMRAQRKLLRLRWTGRAGGVV